MTELTKENLASRQGLNESVADEETRLNAAEASSDEVAIDEGFKRRIVAFTVGAVILLSLLIVLMCYQMIKIGVVNARKAEFNAKIAELRVLREKGENTLEYLRTKEAIERLAYSYDLVYPDDIKMSDLG